MSLIIASIEELMNDYRVVHLVEVVNSLKGLEVTIEKLVKDGNRDVRIKNADLSVITPVLETGRVQCELLELKKALRRLDELRGPINSGCLTFEQLRVQVQELRKDMGYELSERRFAYVPVDHVDKLYKQSADWHVVWGVFPDSVKDVQDATDCYVLKLYTACVFHSMRIAEIGLRELGKKLGIIVTNKGQEIPLDFADWNKVIEQINGKIEAAHKLPTDAKREKELRFYSDMADRCGYMKDLWRNPVSHARKIYIKGEALGVLERVHGFMSLLAEQFQEKNN
jgi:hypothetical protein